MATLGTEPPKRVTINELTTVASVWTGAQFLKGTSLSGNALGLRIAAGNVPNLVDIETGGLGPIIQDPLNSSQTPTLATFNTLGDLLAACVTRVRSDACNKLFAAATPPGGTAPTDALSAMQNIARCPWHEPKKLFALLDEFYPLTARQRWRAAPFIPYLNFDPSAWALSLVYAGGGLNSLGGIAVDGEGNMWADDNFMVGAQSTLYGQFGGGLSKIAPNGRPISPMTFGYRGGGIDGPGFGIAISADDKVWATSLRPGASKRAASLGNMCVPLTPFKLLAIRRKSDREPGNITLAIAGGLPQAQVNIDAQLPDGTITPTTHEALGRAHP